MNFLTKLAATGVLGAVLALAAPSAALAYYPYTWMTGTSYMVGPDNFVGGGGFATGPSGIYSQGPNSYYGNTCGVYGCPSNSYNAMSGQWSNGGNNGYNYNNANYGGYSNSYANSYSQYGNYMQYVPAQAQQYMGYGGYSGYRY